MIIPVMRVRIVGNTRYPSDYYLFLSGFWWPNVRIMSGFVRILASDKTAGTLYHISYINNTDLPLDSLNFKPQINSKGFDPPTNG